MLVCVSFEKQSICPNKVDGIMNTLICMPVCFTLIRMKGSKSHGGEIRVRIVHCVVKTVAQTGGIEEQRM